MNPAETEGAMEARIREVVEEAIESGFIGISIVVQQAIEDYEWQES